jgi:repressor LexA
MKYGVTKKQLELFNFIKNYIIKNTISPSFEEMKNAVGLNSKCTVSARLKQLEERGWIEKKIGKNRSIIILSQQQETIR